MMMKTRLLQTRGTVFGPITSMRYPASSDVSLVVSLRGFHLGKADQCAGAI